MTPFHFLYTGKEGFERTRAHPKRHGLYPRGSGVSVPMNDLLCQHGTSFDLSRSKVHVLLLLAFASPMCVIELILHPQKPCSKLPAQKSWDTSPSTQFWGESSPINTCLQCHVCHLQRLWLSAARVVICNLEKRTRHVSVQAHRPKTVQSTQLQP